MYKIKKLYPMSLPQYYKNVIFVTTEGKNTMVI